MVFAVTIVLGGFGLLYLAVSTEERHLKQNDRSGKR